MGKITVRERPSDQLKVGELPSAEQWWKRASCQARYSYLKAKYASLHLEIIDEDDLPCPQCAGAGNNAYLAWSGGGKAMKQFSVKCPSCHGLGFYREIRYH